jgi:RHH-type proline utilization regulon transcriptional repressor/proline dehydrogenase/delta 1-pyrroline-5-carboxylate dehydrogenase
VQSAHPVRSPIDGATVGTVIDTPLGAIDAIVQAGAGSFREWSDRPVEERAAALDRLSDLLEADRDALVALLAREGGKTLNDGIGEVRETVDFCRYYAAEARRLFAGETMPGPAAASSSASRRGTFPCRFSSAR